MSKANRCDTSARASRMAKAKQFLVAAETIATVIDDQEIADAFVTLCIHAGIAAADVICCAKLGLYYSGENHNEAVAFLRTVDKASAKQLKALLDMKTRSGYSPALTSAADQKRPSHAAAALVITASSC